MSLSIFFTNKQVVLASLLLFLLPLEVLAQDFQFQEINYTIEEGLPSNECHDLLQDSLGYIWIATDRGLVRFDGYKFNSYGIPDGLTNIACLDLVFDKYQNIWIHTLGGQIFKCETESETITPFEYQTVIDSFLNFNIDILDFAVDEKDQLILATNALGFLSIQVNNGYLNLIRGGHQNDKSIKLTFGVNTNLMISNDSRYNSDLNQFVLCNDIDGGTGYCQDYINYKNKLFKSPLSLSKSEGYNNLEAFQISEDNAIIQNYGITFFFEDQNLINAKKNDQFFTDIVRFGDKKLLVGGMLKDGLKYFENFERLKKYEGMPLLEGISISKILVDNENNIWATSLESGLFYLKKNRIQELTILNFNKPNISNVEVDNETIYLVTDKNKVIIYDNKLNRLVHKAVGEIRTLLFIDDLDLLIIGKTRETIALDKNGKQNQFKALNYARPIDTSSIQSNEIFSFEEDEIFLCQGKNFYKFNDNNQLAVFDHLSQSTEPVRVLAMAKVQDDYFLLGTTKGLKRLKNNKVESHPNSPSELTNRINTLIKHKDWYIFGTQGNGLFFWDLQDRHLHILQEDGLLSNNIETLFIDDQSNLFVGTKSGLSKIDLSNFENYQIKNYTRFHGLPSNDVMDIDQKGDSILIATSKGIGVFQQELVSSEKHQARITGIQINNDWYDFKKAPPSFSHKKNNIRIAYQSIDYKMQGIIPYRYRLNDEGWIKTKSTAVNYPALPAGDYSFQLQSQNIDEQWSDAVNFNFTINKPWWRSNWFFLICLLAILLFSYLFYKNRTNRLKEKITTEREIRDLERSALQAQMNPHFIFNCLNSIQKFILKNDKESAMDYLAKFAQLIRQSLNASTQNHIFLDQEIAMLQNYLDLEKLRFKDKFDFSINVSEDINPLEIHLPPLLIQPFVENAIVHGMQDKKTNGWISIHFSKQDANHIQVRIQDNGLGLTENKTKSTHKSLGTSITANRLAFNNKIKDGSYKIMPKYSSEGTIIDITIQIGFTDD